MDKKAIATPYPLSMVFASLTSCKRTVVLGPRGVHLRDGRMQCELYSGGAHNPSRVCQHKELLKKYINLNMKCVFAAVN